MKIFLLSLIIIFKTSTFAVASESIVGAAEAISGDTIRIDNEYIKLANTIALPTDAICKDSLYGNFRCGVVSREKLASFLEEEIVDCIVYRWNDDGKKVADCKVVSSGNQLGNLMVLSGWSLVRWFDRDQRLKPMVCSMPECQNVSPKLFELEAEAIKNNRGLWNTQFDPPWISKRSR